MKMEQMPAVAGLFVSSETGTFLRGTICRSCNSYYFPATLTCKNPDCREKNTEEVRFSNKGTLYSYTVQPYIPPPPFRMEPVVPFAIGMVELPERIRVIGMMDGIEFEDLRTGMAVELGTKILYEDESGADVITYVFRPALEGQATDG